MPWYSSNLTKKIDQLPNLNTVPQSIFVLPIADNCGVIFVSCTFIDSCFLIIKFNLSFRLILFWLVKSYLNLSQLRSCLTLCIFTVGMQFRSLQRCIQMHQKPCYLNGVREVNMIRIWLVLWKVKKSRKWYEEELPSGMRSGGSQMTTPRE